MTNTISENFADCTEELCYKYIAEIKWEKEAFCKHVVCSSGKAKVPLMEATRRSALPFSKKCALHGHIESPVDRTIFKGVQRLTDVFALFALFAFQGTSKNRLDENKIQLFLSTGFKSFSAKIPSANQIRIRLRDEQEWGLRLLEMERELSPAKRNAVFEKAFEQMSRRKNEHNLSLKTITRYRTLFQDNIELLKPRLGANSLVMVKKVWYRKDDDQVIYVAKEFSSTGQVFAEVYVHDSEENMIHFLKKKFSSACKIILFDTIDIRIRNVHPEKVKEALKKWSVYIPEMKEKRQELKKLYRYFPSIIEADSLTQHEIVKLGEDIFRDMKFEIEEISEVISSWMESVRSTTYEKLQKHINECIRLVFMPNADAKSLIAELIRNTTREA